MKNLTSNNTQSLNNIIQLLLYTFILLANFNGIITFTSNFIDHLYFLNFWKEAFIISISAIMIYYAIITIYGWIFAYKQKSNFIPQKIALILLLVILIEFTSIILINVLIAYRPTKLTLFQIKLDILPIIFASAWVAYTILQNSATLTKILFRIKNILIISGVINSIAAILQSTLLNDFIREWIFSHGYTYGTVLGIRIITIHKQIRAFGFTNGFLHLGYSLLFILALHLLINAPQVRGPLNKKNHRHIKLTLSLIFIVGIIASLSKGAIIGLIILLTLYSLQKAFTNARRFILPVLIILTPFFILLGSLTILTKDIAALVSLVSSFIARNSIQARTDFVYKLFLWKPNGLIFGFGWGKHGTYLPEQSQIPLDSLFIYILANYGLFGLLIFFVLGIIILYILHKTGQKWYLPKNSLKQRLLQFLSFITFLFFFVDVFFNNVIATFPLIYYIVIVGGISYAIIFNTNIDSG